MTDIFIPLAVIAIFCAVLYGWGRCVRWITTRKNSPGARQSWAVTLCLGLALLIALGGILNLVRLANVWGLSALTAVGLALCVAPWIGDGLARNIQSLRSTPRQEIAGRGLLLALALAVLVFTVATQLPPALYNFGDDLQKYFAHPVRMLDTGTLFGSPLSAMGSESLGGMAFLLGFVAAYFPLTYLNGVDAVLGLLLCLLLVAGFAWRRPLLVPVSVVAMATLFAINPQYVNISTLYMGSALCLSAIFFTTDPDDGGEPPSPLALGLMYAALIVLKPTFLIFAGLHGLFMVIVVIRTAGGARTGLLWGASLLGWSLLFFVPWAALHAPHFVTALTDPVTGTKDKAPVVIGLIDLFSTRKLFYGATLAHYSGAMVAVLFSMAAAWCPFGNREDGPIRRSAASLMALGVASVVGYLLVLLVAGPLLAGYGTVLRYFIPIIIAVLPAALCLSGLHFARAGSRRAAMALGVLPLIIGLIAVGVFLPTLSARVNQAIAHGSIHAFTRLATSERYLEDNRRVLSPEMRQRIRALQERVPEGAPILAWINAPFALNYTRNPITDVDIAGLTTPWARIGGAQTADAPRYVLWEYRGYGVRTPRQYARQAHGKGLHERAIARRSFPLTRYLQEQSQTAQLLHNDGTIALFLTTAPLSWP